MNVQLRKQPAGCIYWPLTIMSFGLVALLISWGERHFVRQMDANGILTRGGRRIAWNEFTSLVRWKGKLEGTVLSDEYILQSPKGKVSLPLWRTVNAQETRDFLLQHIPPSLLQEKR